MVTSRIYRKEILLVAVIALAGVGACNKPVEEQAEIVRPIKMITVQGGGAGRSQEYSGQVASTSTADIGFEVSGRIVEFLVMDGQEVEQGAMLARLDPADYQSGVNQAEADFRAAETNFRRYEELAETGAVSRQAVDQSRRNFEVTAAALETARKALADTQLRAPFAGNIGRTYVDNFTNVAAKEPVVLIQNLLRLEVVIAVPEQDWAKARPGRTFAETTATFNPVAILSTFPGKEFPLVFSEVATVADPVTRTFEIRLTLDRPEDIAIMPGMTARVRITAPDNADAAGAPILLPTAAVFGNDDGGSSVWVVDRQTMTVSESVINAGEISANGIYVLSGIEPGDTIAVSGVANLREGMQVREYGR